MRHVISQTAGYNDALGGNAMYSPHSLNVSSRDRDGMPNPNPLPRKLFNYSRNPAFKIIIMKKLLF